MIGDGVIQHSLSGYGKVGIENDYDSVGTVLTQAN